MRMTEKEIMKKNNSNLTANETYLHKKVTGNEDQQGSDGFFNVVVLLNSHLQFVVCSLFTREVSL